MVERRLVEYTVEQGLSVVSLILAVQERIDEDTGWELQGGIFVEVYPGISILYHQAMARYERSTAERWRREDIESLTFEEEGIQTIGLAENQCFYATADAYEIWQGNPPRFVKRILDSETYLIHRKE